MTAKITAITAKNHVSQLTLLVSSILGTNQRIQDFIAFGVAHYVDVKNKGNASYLTDLVLALNETKSSAGKTVKLYIQAHTNLQFTDKDKVLAFRKVGKKTNPEALELTVSWFDWAGNNANKATPEINLIGQVTSLSERITNGLADGKAFKDMQLDALDKSVQGLLDAISTARKELFTEDETVTAK